MSVIAFPGQPKPDIAAEARAFAEAIDDGQYSRIDAALVITTGKHLQCLYWGESLDIVQAIGVLEVAKTNLVKRLLGE